MKLVFKKDEGKQIVVLQELNGKEDIFSYVDMIKDLIKTKKMEDPEISKEFSDAEIKSINSMVTFINKELTAIESDSQPGNSNRKI